MNETREVIESDDERRLRELLVDPAADTSRAHDARVLGAARTAAAELRAEVQGQARKPRRSRWNVPLSLAAALVLAVGVYWGLTNREPDDSLRGGGDQSALVPRPGEELEGAPAQFRWRAVPGATTYRVTVRDAEARVLWQSPLVHEAQAASAPDSLAPGGVYLWSVDVQGPGLDQQLGPYSFRLKRE
jgi:hypothetical protein